MPPKTKRMIHLAKARDAKRQQIEQVAAGESTTDQSTDLPTISAEQVSTCKEMSEDERIACRSILRVGPACSPEMTRCHLVICFHSASTQRLSHFR